MPAELREKRRARDKSGVERISRDGATRAVARIARALHEDRGSMETLDEARADDAQHAGVPLFVREDDRAATGLPHAARFGDLDRVACDLLLDRSAFVVDRRERLRDLLCARSRCSCEELHRVSRVAEPSAGVEPGREPEARIF